MIAELYIVGAGGLGRELLSWLKDSPAFGRDWKPIGFLDDDPSVQERDLPLPWAGTVADFEPSNDRLVVLGLGNSKPREEVVKRLMKKGANFFSYVHPSVIMGDRVEIGEGVVICPRCVLTCDLKVGAYSFLNLNVTAGHDVQIGEFASISSQVDLCGGVVLERGVWIGSGARIIPGRHVGEWARIGAGSVVIRNVPPRMTVFGNPAKKI
jgi:sugar O-acyltransferase (sialic acid O-acetyltransferase NeuD family)